MQVNRLNFISMKRNYNSSLQNKNFTTPLKQENDVFVKSKQLSFKGESSGGIVPVGETIIGYGGLAAALLIPLITATAIANGQNPDEIFLSDETYLGKADSLFVDTKKAEELGFNLNPENYEIKNLKTGVFKDFDLGTEINLKEGKYIDEKNGIFIDPQENVSVIFTKGDAMPVILPNFGSGYPTRPEDIRWSGHNPPENEPIDERTLFEKVKDFFNNEAETNPITIKDTNHINDYMKENHPDFYRNLKTESPSMSNYLERIEAKHSQDFDSHVDDSDDSNNDEPEHIDNHNYMDEDSLNPEDLW